MTQVKVDLDEEQNKFVKKTMFENDLTSKADGIRFILDGVINKQARGGQK